MAAIGTIIDGKYEILKKIGQGGMSVVYLAMDNRLNKQWAIKEVRREGIKDFEIVKQGLLVETNMLKKLSHSHLPRIVDIIETQETIYVVMDYVEGKPLSYLLNEYGAQPQENVVDWAKQLCDVLQYLHTRTPPIIYRDMKPANIMLKPDGNVTLIDFGIAREYKESNLSDTTYLGTRGYAAPEQFGGNGQTDPRTDIYCLGATLYHLLTGHNPCEPPYEMYPIRQWNPSLSAGLEKIITKCTQRNPEDRYQSCAELLYAFEHYDAMDDKYRKKQIRKLVGFSIPAVLCIAGIVVSIVGYKGILNQRNTDYSNRLNEAAKYESVSHMKGQFSTDVVDEYNAAIEIDPYQDEAYIKLLEYYSRMGQTNAGLGAITFMIEINKGDLQKNDEVLMEVARLFFNGDSNDTSFSKSYEKAARYFGMVNKKVVPEAKYYESLSNSLSISSAKIQWATVIKDLQDFEKFNDEQEKNETQIANYLSLASVYITNNKYILQSNVDPYTTTINILDKMEGTMEFLDEQSMRDKYQIEMIRMQADAYYFRAISASNINKEDLDVSIDKYEALVPLLGSEQAKLNMRQKIAQIYYKDKKDYGTAAKMYEEIIKDYPEDSKAYSSYGIMALVDMNDKAKAVELYNKAKQLESSSKDTNFSSLELKLKNAGAI
ncbi:MAG: protein kinase [Bacteroidales bacterium]|nr:protein kinase [Bacteroidales bacterium]